MSNYSAEKLYELLPAVYRLKDAGHGYPLRDLVEVIAEQATVLELDIVRLYENWFIETCDSWVVPYIGDLIGVRGTHPANYSRRAEVANTISYRRRKGTAAVLEQLARDGAGWPARVVEFFELLSTTQHLNHLRPHNLRTPDLRRADMLELLDGPFDTIAHTAEVRRIVERRGKYNISNVGLFLWRLTAYPLEAVTPHRVGAGGRAYTFSVLGKDEPLFNHPIAETSATHIAEEINVPAPIRRRAMHYGKELYYGEGLSIEVEAKYGSGTLDKIDIEKIVVCDLSGWAHGPKGGKVAIDPVLGRLAFAEGDAPPSRVRVSYYHGFSADIGGGQYERERTFTDISDETAYTVGEGGDHATLNAALLAWNGTGSAVIEIRDSATYEESITAAIPAGCRLEIRAANKQRPTLLLTGKMEISGGKDSGFEINGLLIANDSIEIRGLERARLRHCTLEPVKSGRVLTVHDKPELTVECSILGGIRTSVDCKVEITDSIVDAIDKESNAYADTANTGGGGALTVVRSTVIGTVDTRELTLAENSIFMGVVRADRRQKGCVRFSHVPLDSKVPRRYRCQPVIPEDATDAEKTSLAAQAAPLFTSLEYGDPGYCQLRRSCPDVIANGAEDESEMGVFSSLQQPQREANLRIRLDEYLNVGLEAGIFFAT